MSLNSSSNDRVAVESGRMNLGVLNSWISIKRETRAYAPWCSIVHLWAWECVHVHQSESLIVSGKYNIEKGKRNWCLASDYLIERRVTQWETWETGAWCLCIPVIIITNCIILYFIESSLVLTLVLSFCPVYFVK